MIPTQSNTADKGCTPVSSNCVIWQGPNLSCINLCTGDSVSDVIYKLATQLCQLQTDTGLTDVDLTCLVNVCQASPTPTLTLSAVLNLLISKVCCLSDIVKNLPTTPGSTYTEPTLDLPACLQYINAQGQTVTSLIHNQYTLTLAQKVCAINTQVTTLNTTVSNHETRISTLENKTGYTLPNITPVCVLPSTATPIDQVLIALENKFCTLQGILGSVTSLTAAAAQQCNGLSSAQSLSGIGTMSSLTGWNSIVTTFAQSFQNLWITVCDMRDALNTIKSSVSTVDCTQFILAFTASGSTDRTQVTLFFNGQTIIPSGFTNCNQLGSIVTISDGSKTFSGYVDLVAASTNTSGITFTVSGSGTVGLNTSQNYTVTVEGCVTKNGQTCSKTATETVYVPCPVVTGVSASLS